MKGEKLKIDSTPRNPSPWDFALRKDRFEIKIDPIDFHPGLREKMKEFSNEVSSAGERLARKLENKLSSRFCHVCFFGKVKGEVNGEPMCEECAFELYGLKDNGLCFDKKKFEDLNRQLWYRKRKALAVFEAYLSAECRSFEAEQKLEQLKKERKK